MSSPEAPRLIHRNATSFSRSAFRAEGADLIPRRCATVLGVPTPSPSRDGLHPVYSGRPAQRPRAAVAAPRGGRACAAGEHPRRRGRPDGPVVSAAQYHAAIVELLRHLSDVVAQAAPSAPHTRSTVEEDTTGY
jgi:hypothetical protein